MAALQEKMQALLDSLVAAGRERGVQLAVYLNGELVVDAWAGHADPEKTKPVTGDTLFPVFSVTKGIAATAAHLTVERGLVGYDTPVAEVWPEFAAAGKGGITLAHVLNHTAGMQMLPAGLSLDGLYDWERMCGLLAAASPVSRPSESQVYHAMTFGWLVGEVVRRVDGRPLPRVVREDICLPLGLHDLFIGTPEELDGRVAILEAPAAAPPPDDTPRDVPRAMWPLHHSMNRRATRRAVLPASNGIMTARGIARHYAALLPGGAGGAGGVRLLTDARLREATRPPNPAVGGAIGLGYMLGHEQLGASAFGHAGYGGAQGLAVPDLCAAVGFTKNLFTPEGATADVLAALRRELDAL